ncbi:unnamed protein product [Hydatigera taeniaeformis]|uniref:Secreted protein n=1 Tax=Hydatigena taeniaeformis TaxID=6205 RepID=A0A0R3WWL7_HYDTA|nr:unnamed protein product [Hydatigera taeniaeformis]
MEPRRDRGLLAWWLLLCRPADRPNEIPTPQNCKVVRFSAFALQNNEDTVESSHRVHRRHPHSLRRSNTPSVTSLPPTPNRSHTAPPASVSPGEQWRRFQSQVSSYFSRGGGSTGGGGSSSTSTSTPPPTEKSSSRRPG